jgi:hypothetical protein
MQEKKTRKKTDKYPTNKESSFLTRMEKGKLPKKRWNIRY